METFPTNIMCKQRETYSDTVVRSKRYLGNRSVEQPMKVSLTVILNDYRQMVELASWWVHNLDFGYHHFTIDLMIMGQMKTVTAKLLNDLTESLQSGDTRLIKLDLEIVSLASNTIPVDGIAPVITITGSNETVLIGHSYTDLGATAVDNVDGDITSSIIVVNNVDNSKEGSYSVTYNVTDAEGNHAIEKTRIVTVLPSPFVSDHVWYKMDNFTVLADGTNEIVGE